MKTKFWLLSVFIVSCFLSVSAQFPWGAQSQIKFEKIDSKNLNETRDVTIFLPRSYETNKEKTYPVLYLLHGIGDNNHCWINRGHLKDVYDRLIANGEAVEMIIVTPNAGGNIAKDEWNGYFDLPGWDYEKFFFQELMPYVETNYRAKTGKENTAVAGLSMGGGGATVYGQKHPDKFGSVYAMSALMDVPQSGAINSNNPDDKLSKLNKAVKENSCAQFVINADDDTKNQLRTVNWYIDCGDDDFLLDRNIEFYQAMRNAGIPAQFRIRDGGHDWEYWHSALYTCLPYVSNQFRAAQK